MKNYDEITREVLAKRDAHKEKMKKRNRMIMGIGVPTVSLCLALIIGVGMIKTGEFDVIPDRDADIITGGAAIEKIETAQNGLLPVDDDKRIPENGEEMIPSKDVPIPETSPVKYDECPEGGDEIWIEPQWGEKALYAKYPAIDLGNDIIYSTAATWIDSSMVGEPIIEAIAYGYDIYTDTEYKMDVTLYFINGISPEAAVAVSYDGFEGQYAVYTDHWYYPETLGDFIEALSLKENLTFGNLSHYWHEYGSFAGRIYEVNDPDVIWGMLLSDGTLQNLANEVSDEELSEYKEFMTVSVSVDILGISNVALTVTEDGYLHTNILATRKVFFIGEKKAHEFFDYVEENFAPLGEELAATTAVVTGGEVPEITGEDTAVMTELPYIPDDIVVATTSEEWGSGSDSYEVDVPSSIEEPGCFEPSVPSEEVYVTEPAIEIVFE